MNGKTKVGLLTICECGRLKGQHGWLEIDLTNMTKLIDKADTIVNEECDVCQRLRERLEMLRETSEGCSCVLDI